MSLSGIEWSDLAVLSRHLSALISKKNLTEEEKYVTMWLEKQEYDEPKATSKYFYKIRN